MATREAQASLRLSMDLKGEIQKIATETRRTLSNTIELLLWRGVADFKTDGVLRSPSEAKTQAPRLDQSAEKLAKELAELVLETALKEARERSGGSSPPRKRRGRRKAA